MYDHILIKKAKDGCNESFDKLIKERGSKLYKVAFSYVKNENTALEVVSEATYKAYINIKKLKKIEFFDTWLMKIVINESINILKKQKNIISFEDYKRDIPADNSSDVEEKVDLQVALDKLKKNDKEILVLKYFADLTFAEIATSMNKSENTIKTKHYRALEKVKNMLQGEK